MGPSRPPGQHATPIAWENHRGAGTNPGPSANARCPQDQSSLLFPSLACSAERGCEPSATEHRDRYTAARTLRRRRTWRPAAVSPAVTVVGIGGSLGPPPSWLSRGCYLQAPVALPHGCPLGIPHPPVFLSAADQVSQHCGTSCRSGRPCSDCRCSSRRVALRQCRGCRLRSAWLRSALRPEPALP